MASIISAGTTSGTALNMAGDTSGQLQLATNGSTTAVTIDTSQNVGIGTTSPSTYGKLALAGASSSPITFGIDNTTVSTNAGGTKIGFTYGTAAVGYILNQFDGADFNTSIQANQQLRFLTGTSGGSERMRITSGGDVLMGTALLALRGNGTLNLVNSSSGQIVYRNNTQGAGKYWFSGVESSNDVFFVYPGTTSGGVYLTYGATSWAGNSDERLKTNLKPIENAIEKVSTLRAVTGRFKADEEGVSRSFLIAQDVQAVLPEAVNTKDDEMGTLGLRYTDVIPLLTAAIKEQQTIINDLKARITALEGAK